MILGDVDSVPLNHTTEGLVSGCRCSSLLASLLFLSPPLPGSDQIQPPWPHLALSPPPPPYPSHRHRLACLARVQPSSAFQRIWHRGVIVCERRSLIFRRALMQTPPASHSALPTYPTPRRVALPNSPALTAHDTPSLCFVFCRVFFPSPIPSALAFQREVNLSRLGAQNGNYWVELWSGGELWDGCFGDCFVRFGGWAIVLRRQSRYKGWGARLSDCGE